jgi:hypothetical protein
MSRCRSSSWRMLSGALAELLSQLDLVALMVDGCTSPRPAAWSRSGSTCTAPKIPLALVEGGEPGVVIDQRVYVVVADSGGPVSAGADCGAGRVRPPPPVGDAAQLLDVHAHQLPAPGWCVGGRPILQLGLTLHLVAGAPGVRTHLREIRIAAAMWACFQLAWCRSNDQRAAVNADAVDRGTRRPPGGCGPSTSHTPLGGPRAFKPDPPSPTSWPSTPSASRGVLGRGDGETTEAVPPHGVQLPRLLAPCSASRLRLRSCRRAMTRSPTESVGATQRLCVLETFNKSRVVAPSAPSMGTST